jgi:hypothetical protein
MKRYEHATLTRVAVRITAVVMGTRARILRIDEINADVSDTPEARLAFIADKWDGALAALSHRDERDGGDIDDSDDPEPLA